MDQSELTRGGLLLAVSNEIKSVGVTWNTNYSKVVECGGAIIRGRNLKACGHNLSNRTRRGLNQHGRNRHTRGSNAVAVDVNQTNLWSWNQLLTGLTTGWWLSDDLDRVGNTVGDGDALVRGQGDLTVGCLVGDVIGLHRTTKCQSVDGHVTVGDVDIRLRRH